jgi:RNA polymerase sigma-70 factor (ECF subfamily)
LAIVEHPDAGRTPDTDVEVVREIASGSTRALAALYDRYAPVLFALARRIVVRPEDAEEVVQDVFAQVWRQADRYQFGRASVAGWLVMIARARAIDRLRGRRARPDADDRRESIAGVSLPSADPDPEQLMLSAQDARRIKSACAELPEDLRSVMDLAFYRGLTHSEIAATTGLPLGTVKTRLRAAMEFLRRRMDAAT